MTTLAEHACAYVNAGWAVFPCRRDKRPLVKGGFHAASCDRDEVTAWWTRWHHGSMGTPVPPPFAVLDMECAHDGEDTLRALEAVHGQLVETLTYVLGTRLLEKRFGHCGNKRRSRMANPRLSVVDLGAFWKLK